MRERARLKKREEKKRTAPGSMPGSSKDQVALGASPIASVTSKSSTKKQAHAGACSSKAGGTHTGACGSEGKIRETSAGDTGPKARGSLARMVGTEENPGSDQVALVASTIASVGTGDEMQWETTETSWWTTPWTSREWTSREPWWSSWTTHETWGSSWNKPWWSSGHEHWWDSNQWWRQSEPWWSSQRQSEPWWSSQTPTETAKAATKPKYCFRYQKDGCKLGDSCPYLHEVKSTPSKASAPQPGSSGDLFGLSHSGRLDLTVDSGAAVSAIPRDAAQLYETTEAEPKTYTSASGHAVPTLGCKRTVLRFQNGKTGAVEFDVMDVPKPLLSVSKVLKKGYRVVFDTECSYIENKKNGEWFKLYERGGVFVLPSWLCHPNGGQASKL